MPDLAALVLAVAALLGRGTPTAAQADAVAAACTEEAAAHPVDPNICVALLAVYVSHESHWIAHPAPVSADARNGTSCGLLQVPCRWSSGPLGDARLWLRWVRESSLASVTGFGRAGRRISAARVREATEALAQVGGR